MKLLPTLDRIAIRREKRETVTSGGIHLPEQAKKESNFGEVVAVGPGAFNMDGSRRGMSIKVGDRVLFFDNYETDSGIDGIVIADEEDVRAVVE